MHVFDEKLRLKRLFRSGVSKLFTRKDTFEKILKARVTLTGRAKKGLPVLMRLVFY